MVPSAALVLMFGALACGLDHGAVAAIVTQIHRANI